MVFALFLPDSFADPRHVLVAEFAGVLLLEVDVSNQIALKPPLCLMGCHLTHSRFFLDRLVAF